MNIYIKNINIVDSEKIAKWKSDSKLSELIMSHAKQITNKNASEWIKNNTEDLNQRLYGIYLCSENLDLLLGITRLMFIDFEARVAEFGIYIGDTEQRGRGYGRLAMQLTINQAFDVLNLNKVFLKVNSKNHNAIDLYHKLGFSIEGVQKDHYYNENENKYEDIIFMSKFNPVIT